MYKKRNKKEHNNYWVISFLNLPGKVHVKSLEES